MIRGKIKKCPFGLDITKGCKTAGDSIFKMIAIDSDESPEDAREYNYRVMLAVSLDQSDASEQRPCVYADLIIESKNSVDCKYGDSINFGAAGNIGFQGSPNYAHLYVGNSTNSTNGYPLSYYTDDNPRTIYYGLVGLLP